MAPSRADQDMVRDGLVAHSPDAGAPNSGDDVQLFAFDTSQTATVSGGRPKRKLKAIARFESMSFAKAGSGVHCKIGEGFSCPRCSAVCSYDAKQCEECQLSCYYEAGIGVVVLKERKVNVERQHIAAAQRAASGGGESSAIHGTLSMQKVTLQRNKTRQSHPQTDGKGKRRSHSPATKSKQSQPTDGDTLHPAQPAEGLPTGWLFRRIPRSKGNRKDPIWYSPGERYKFRSKPDAQRFIQNMEENGGDEAAAIQTFQNRFGKRWSPGPGCALKGEVSEARAEADEAKAETDDETDDRKMSATPHASLGAAGTGNDGSPFLGVQHILHAAKLQRSKCDGEAVTIKHPHRKCKASGCNRYKEARCDGYCHTHFEIFGPSDSDDGGPDAYEREEPPPRKPPPQLPSPQRQPAGANPLEEELEVMRAKLKAATESNAFLSNLVASLRGTNGELANLVSDKDDALQEAENTIAALRNDASRKDDGDRVTALESLLATEQSSAKDLKHRLGDAEKDVARLSQINERLQSNLTEATSQRDQRMAELQDTSESLETATQEKDEMSKKLSEIESEAATKESQLRETIATLETSIEKKVEEKLKEKEAAWASQVSELEKKLSKAKAERAGRSRLLSAGAAITAELMTCLGTSSSERQSEPNKGKVDEGKMQELLSEAERAKETVATLQAEKDELALQLQRMNASVGTMKLENEIRLNKAETEIGTLKQQASKTMSQVYDLTDQLSAALTEKEELEATLESTTDDLTQTQERAEAQRRKITRLESSIASLTVKPGSAKGPQEAPPLITDDSKAEITRLEESEKENKAKISRLEQSEKASKAKISRLEETEKSSKAKITRLKSEKADAVAKSTSLEDQLSTAAVARAKLRARLESATEDLAQMQELDETQKEKISQLESYIASVTAKRDSEKSEGSGAGMARLETEKAEAVAKSTSLEKTVDELQGRVERLSADLNASKTLSNQLKSEVTAANAKSDTFESRHTECLNELERIINEKSRVPREAQYKATIDKLEENIDKQNEDLRGLSDALITADSQMTDLIAQVSTLTTERDAVTAERDELRGIVEEASRAVEEASKEVSQLQTTVNSLEAQHQIGNAAEHSLSIIDSEKDTLVVKVNDCISWLALKGEEMTAMIDEIKTNVAKMRVNGTAATLDMSEILSRAEKIEQRLSEEEADVGKLVSDVGKLEARMKKEVQSYRDQYLVTTKDCKATLKQKRKTLEALKASLASFCKEEQMETNRALSPNHISDVSDKGEEGALELEDTGGGGILDSGALQNESEESGDVPLFAFDVSQEQYNWGRPKRKLKAIARFQSMTFDRKAAHTKIGEGFSCPRCSASCTYDSKECEECQLKCYYEAGIGVVVLKERKVDTTDRATKPSHPSAQKKGRSISKKRLQGKGHKGGEGTPAHAWTKIEHAKLLPDGGKEYPRELSRAIEFIDAQCKKQEENVEVARDEWKGSCTAEAEAESKAIDEENVLFRRGLRERSRMADQERLEKLRYAEKADEVMIRHTHEGGGKRRSKEYVEETKLCSQPIVFSGRNATGPTEYGAACTSEDCQFCKKDSVYRQHVLLESEMDRCKSGGAIQSPLMKNPTKILNPPAGPIDEDHFQTAESGGKAGTDSTDNEALRQLRAEEGKLEKLRDTKRRLEFVKNYNEGLMSNAWAGTKKAKRKSSI